MSSIQRKVMRLETSQSETGGRTECIFCRAGGLHDVIDLGVQPCADSFLKPEEVGRGMISYPLVVQLCLSCGNAQNKFLIPPLDRYQKYEYSYTSSHSESSKSYWREFAKFLLPLLPSKGVVVEVGSNDGYLLSLIALAGHRVMGVDASPQMVAVASEAGVESVCDLFGIDTVRTSLTSFVGRVDAVLANNVFNHSDNPNSFLDGVTDLLSEDGVFVFESPYWVETLQSMRFDQIYHEHVTYPTICSIRKLLSRHGLVINDVLVSDYHGGSMRIVAKRAHVAVESPKVDEMMRVEIDSAVFDCNFYSRYQTEINKRRNKLLLRICKIRVDEPDAKIFCVGAAAKGNTFLNFNRLDRSLVDFITDVSPSKIGKFTPITNIPIVSDVELKNHSNIYVILLSWNLAEKLQEIVLELNPSAKFLA